MISNKSQRKFILIQTCHVWKSITWLLSKNNKGSLSYTNPVKILTVFSELLLPYLTGLTKYSITTSSFPDKLKLAELMSAFKKVEHFDKDNYRPISLLSHTWKTYEKNTFQPNHWLHRTLFLRPPDKHSKYTALLNKNARKMKLPCK